VFHLNLKFKMLFPTLCVDNFFTEPNKIISFSKTLKYNSDPFNIWPGTRTENLINIDKFFVEHFGNKVLSLLYPIEYKNINFELNLNFQKISYKNKKEGWVHKDNPMELTAIVYLSKHKECGTKLFEYNGITPILKHQENKQLKNENELKENKINFNETIHFKSKFNRLILFDSSQWHSANKYSEENIKEDRLILIGFFKTIFSPFIKYPCVENKRL